MATNKRRKKSNFDLKKVALLAVAVVAIVVALIFATSSNDNTPEYESNPTENNQTNKVEHTEPSTETPTDSVTEPSTGETPTEEPSSEPVTSAPVMKSFYDAVKYRSPDAVTADIFKHGRSLMLLNRQYELPEDFKWDLVYWSNGKYVDAMYLNCEEHNSVKAVDRAAYQPLKDMFAAASEAGVPLNLVSAYRSIYLQDKLFTRSVNSYMKAGYSEIDAINKANVERTFSGTSEHNTGLGFDILEKGNWNLTESFENTPQFKWLMENAENYGFILRYDKDKTNITGIMYEPWHFRYVGVEHAKKMNELGLCLEEYIDYLEA
ncbi:MAG: D-alanyl-D-alanine carboxypeptidase family protein [Clostridia bacterium]|nr:D-alanyl-D-alanine carboxypeptidase family protein [Clostridia bacterium]